MGNLLQDTSIHTPSSKEKRLLHAVHLVNLGLWNYDVKQKLFYFCDETFRIYGLAPSDEAIPFDVVIACIHPEDRAMVTNAFTSIERQVLDVQYRIVCPDQAERVVHSRAEVSPYDSDCTLIYGTVRDITEEVRIRNELRRSRESLVQAVRIAGLGHWEWDAVTRNMWFSKEMYEIYGINPSHMELTQEETAKMTHPEDSKRVETRIREFLYQHGNYEDEYRIVRSDGSIRYVHVLGEALFDPSGKLIVINGTAQDITDRRIQAELLEQSQQRYNSLLRYNPDGICAVDLDGRIMSANPAYQQMLGYSEEELSKMTFLDILFPEDIEWASKIVHGALNGKIHADVEAVLRHKHGHRVNVLCTNIPIVVNGETIGIYAMIKDITAQRKTEAQLHSIFDSAKDAIILTDDAGTILTWNKGAEVLFGYSASERVGRQFQVLGHLQEINGGMPLREDLRLYVDQTTEFVAVHKNGHGTPVDISITSFANGSDIGYIGIIRDISERKQADKLLLKSEKLSAVGQLAAGVAHEIRNPLTALKGFTQLLHYRARGSRRRYLEIMQDELTRIETILNELLVLAKPQVVHMKRLDVGLILEEVITLLNAQAVMHSVNIVSSSQGLEHYVECEGNQLKQVFVNIIKNAIEAMPQGGNIFISLEEEGPDVRITFVDEGHGIAEDRIPKLGEPFYTTKEKGTGLGLMVSHKIIHAHKGTIQIDSKVGEGTRVEIKLPMVPCSTKQS